MSPTLTTIDWRTRFQQQASWTRSLRQYLFTRLGLPDGGRILEVGCGPGVILDEIKTQQISVPQAPADLTGDQAGLQLYGLDIRLDFLQTYAEENPCASLSQGDAHQLPFANGVFDLVICHFLLLWVVNPLQVLKEMRRVCRGGGSLLALAEPDYGGRIDYPQALDKLGKLQTHALRSQGADPEIGRKLRGIFTQAGLCVLETGVLGGQWRSQPPQDEWELEWQVLTHDLGKKLSFEEWQELKATDYQAYQSGSRVLYVPTFYAWGKKIDSVNCSS